MQYLFILQTRPEQILPFGFAEHYNWSLTEGWAQFWSMVWTALDQPFVFGGCTMYWAGAGSPSRHRAFVWHLYSVGPTSSMLVRRCVGVLCLLDCNVVSFNEHNTHYSYFNLISYAYFNFTNFIICMLFTLFTCLVITVVLNILFNNFFFLNWSLIDLSMMWNTRNVTDMFGLRSVSFGVVMVSSNDWCYFMICTDYHKVKLYHLYIMVMYKNDVGHISTIKYTWNM